MELFWDLLFQLMKHGTNTLHVAFIFLSSIRSTQIKLHRQGGEILDQHSYSERLDTHATDLSSDLTYHQASSCCDPCVKRAERSLNWSRSSCSVFTMFFLLWQKGLPSSIFGCGSVCLHHQPDNSSRFLHERNLHGHTSRVCWPNVLTVAPVSTVPAVVCKPCANRFDMGKCCQSDVHQLVGDEQQLNGRSTFSAVCVWSLRCLYIEILSI